jgi:hypothetical protein
MTGFETLHRFLRTDIRDVGCTRTFELIDVYVEMVLARLDAESRYPGVAAHLRACNPCAQDFQGLLALAGT